MSNGRIIVVSLLGALLSCSACSKDRTPEAEPEANDSLTTDTDSRTLSDKEQRLAFLARYLRLKSPVADAEFVIRYHDNGGGALPGPSDWDIQAVLQVEEHASAWHEGWVPCPADAVSEEHPTGVDLTWAQPLLERREPWQQPSDSARCYRNPRTSGSYVIVYEQDGLVLYRNTTERALLPPQ
ncbi:hypothetical protein [Haliangium sp.]|uniref:hypothetical protein n=1 Tax=Haliangium sp. TaxID=2663208 RepID=UPI003D0EFEA6